MWGCIIKKFKRKYPQKLFPLQCDSGLLSGLPRYLRNISPSCCKLPLTVQFLFNCRQKNPFWNTHQNLFFTRALDFSRTLTYPKYFSFPLSVCLLVDPISQISISAELCSRFNDGFLWSLRFYAWDSDNRSLLPVCESYTNYFIQVFVLSCALFDIWRVLLLVQGIGTGAGFLALEIRPSDGVQSKGQFMLLSDRDHPWQQFNLLPNARSVLRFPVWPPGLWELGGDVWVRQAQLVMEIPVHTWHLRPHGLQ